MFDPDGRLLLFGGVNGRKPPRFSAGAAWLVPRCGSGREEFMFDPEGRLLLFGEVNGRKPPRFSAGAAWLVPRCGPGREEFMLDPVGRLLLKLPRFPFCIAD
jgi:hypothetical protein